MEINKKLNIGFDNFIKKNIWEIEKIIEVVNRYDERKAKIREEEDESVEEKLKELGILTGGD